MSREGGSLLWDNCNDVCRSNDSHWIPLLDLKEFVQHFRNPKQVKANCGEPHEILKISQLKLVVYRCQTLTFLPNHCSVFDVVRTFSFLDGEKESSAQATSNK